MNSQELLDEALENAFDDLRSTTLGTKECAAALAQVDKLYRLQVEDMRLDLDYEKAKFNEKNANLELEKSDNKVRHDQIMDYARLGMQGVSAGISGLTFVSLVKAISDIEKQGMPTSKIWQLIFKTRPGK